MARFKIFIDKVGKYRFLLKSNEKQIVFTSKGYPSRLICFNHIRFIKKYASKDEKYERHVSHSGSPYFIFKLYKDKIIGVSEMFLSKLKMENIISLIKNDANIAEIDNTIYSI